MRLGNLGKSAAIAVSSMAMAVPAIVSGASQNGEFSLKGLGYNSCEEFTNARDLRSNDYYRFIGWLEGYLSAYNRFTPDTINIAPWQSTELLADFLEIHCREYPKTPFSVAVDRMIAELVPSRLHKSSDSLTVESSGHKILIYRDILKAMQNALKERGFYDGEIDGLYDERTKNAIKNYQESAKIKKTGMPDQATLYYLLLKKQ